MLWGTDSTPCMNGQCHFRDLAIHHRGRGYEAHFTATPFKQDDSSIIGVTTEFNVCVYYELYIYHNYSNVLYEMGGTSQYEYAYIAYL